MLKKFVLLLTIIAMLGTMISMPAFASEEPTPTKYPVALSGTWKFSTSTEYSALYGKSDGEMATLRVFNNSPKENYAGGAFAFDTKVVSDGYITVNEGDQVKFTVQLAWDDMYDYYSRLADDSGPANYIINFRPLSSTYTSLNDFGVSFKPQDGIFQKASSGPSITGTQTPFMVPEKNWCTYDFVYTIGSDKDTLNVYADGELVLKDLPTLSTLRSCKIAGISLYAPCSILDTPAFAYAVDNFSVTHYPKGSAYEPVANAFDDTALNTADIKFAGLPDGSLHYIGSGAQPSDTEIKSLIKSGSNITTEFVVSSDAANDPGRIGYIKMTHNDGTVRYKKVMGGKVVDLISLNFNDRTSRDSEKDDNSLASGSAEGYHMGYCQGTKGTTYETYYQGGSLGKKANNYAIYYDTQSAFTAGSGDSGGGQGLFFSSQLEDTHDASKAKMSATGIISYEFSLRIPDGLVGKSGSKQLNFRIRNKSTGKTFSPFVFDGVDNCVYYCKTAANFKEQTKEYFDATLDETQWNRYAAIVNTLTDEVSIYRNGVFKWKSPATYKLTSTGVMTMQYTGEVNADFYVDDVVIRSVTPDYVPETFAPEVISDESASWTNNEWRYACSKESTVEDFKSALNVSKDCEVIAYNSDYTPASSFSEAKVIAVKNEDESIIRYYDIVSTAQLVEFDEASLVDVDDEGNISNLTYTSGKKQLTAYCHSYKDVSQNLTLIIAAYNDNALVALNSLSQTTNTDRSGMKEGTVTLEIPEGETVTKFKVFAFDDSAELATLTPWRTSVEWTKKN